MQQVNDLLTQIPPYLSQIAPYLTAAAYAATVLLAVAVLAFMARILYGNCNGLLKLTSRLMIFLGVLFLIFMGLDMATGAGQVAKFSFHQQPFWIVVAALLLPGIFFRLFATLRPTRDW